MGILSATPCSRVRVSMALRLADRGPEIPDCTTRPSPVRTLETPGSGIPDSIPAHSAIRLVAVDLAAVDLAGGDSAVADLDSMTAASSAAASVAASVSDGAGVGADGGTPGGIHGGGVRVGLGGVLLPLITTRRTIRRPSIRQARCRRNMAAMRTTRSRLIRRRIQIRIKSTMAAPGINFLRRARPIQILSLSMSRNPRPLFSCI